MMMRLPPPQPSLFPVAAVALRWRRWALALDVRRSTTCLGRLHVITVMLSSVCVSLAGCALVPPICSNELSQTAIGGQCDTLSVLSWLLLVSSLLMLGSRVLERWYDGVQVFGALQRVSYVLHASWFFAVAILLFRTGIARA